MTVGGQLYFLRTLTTKVRDTDFESNNFEGGYKPIQILPDGKMQLLSRDMIDKEANFFKPVVLDFDSPIKTGNFYANTRKGYIFKAENDYGNLSASFVVVLKPCELSEQEINMILSGELKEGAEIRS